MAIRRKKRTKKLKPLEKATKRAKQLRDLRFRVKMAELKARLRNPGA